MFQHTIDIKIVIGTYVIVNDAFSVVHKISSCAKMQKIKKLKPKFDGWLKLLLGGGIINFAGNQTFLYYNHQTPALFLLLYSLQMVRVPQSAR